MAFDPVQEPTLPIGGQTGLTPGAISDGNIAFADVRFIRGAFKVYASQSLIDAQDPAERPRDDCTLTPQSLSRTSRGSTEGRDRGRTTSPFNAFTAPWTWSQTCNTRISRNLKKVLARPGCGKDAGNM